MTYPTTEILTEEYLLRLRMLRYAIRQTLSEHFLQPEVDVVNNMIPGYLDFIAKFYIPSDVSKTITYPDGWFEAVKDRFLPGFLKRIIPIKRVVIEIDRIFPKLPEKTIRLLGQPAVNISIQKESTIEETP